MRICADGAAAHRGPKDADTVVVAVANQRKRRIGRQRDAIWFIEFGVGCSFSDDDVERVRCMLYPSLAGLAMAAQIDDAIDRRSSNEAPVVTADDPTASLSAARPPIATSSWASMASRDGSDSSSSDSTVSPPAVPP